MLRARWLVPLMPIRFAGTASARVNGKSGSRPTGLYWIGQSSATTHRVAVDSRHGLAPVHRVGHEPFANLSDHPSDDAPEARRAAA